MKKLSYLLILFFVVTSLKAEEDKNYILRKKILEAKKKIEEYNEKKTEIDKKTGEYQSMHGKRIVKRKNDISKLTKDVSKLENELKGAKIEKRRLERSEKNYELKFSLFRAKLKEYLIAYRKEISKGLPYNIENRKTNINRLLSDIDIESISTEEVLNRFNILISKELFLGLESEVFVKNNIKYLRIGWIALAYSDEEGKDAGIITMKNGKWEWENNLNFQMRKAVRDSIKMVEGKKAPDITQFPVSMSIINNDTKGAK